MDLSREGRPKLIKKAGIFWRLEKLCNILGGISLGLYNGAYFFGDQVVWWLLPLGVLFFIIGINFINRYRRINGVVMRGVYIEKSEGWKKVGI